jgi:hypothetical protein
MPWNQKFHCPHDSVECEHAFLDNDIQKLICPVVAPPRKWIFEGRRNYSQWIDPHKQQHGYRACV